MPPPRETGFSWSASADEIGCPAALASEIPNEPPRRSRGRLGGSFVIQRGRALLNDWPPRIWGRAQDSGGGSVSRSRIPGFPPPGCSLLRRGERFAPGDGPDADRTLGRSSRATSPARIGSGLTLARCHSRDLAWDRSGSAFEPGPLRGGEGGQPGGLARGRGPGGIRGRGRRAGRGDARLVAGASPKTRRRRSRSTARPRRRPAKARSLPRLVSALRWPRWTAIHSLRRFTAALSRLGAGGPGPRSVAPPHPGRTR